MALQLLRITLILLAVFLPILIAKVLFRHHIDSWFGVQENSYFSIGFPRAKEGFILSGVILVIVIISLLLINIYL